MQPLYITSAGQEPFDSDAASLSHNVTSKGSSRQGNPQVLGQWAWLCGARGHQSVHVSQRFHLCFHNQSEVAYG